MSPSVKRWIERCGHIPPRHFWSTLIQFMYYAWLQALRAARRDKRGGDIDSHINLKRTHYLEKAILCDTGRTDELDTIYRDLKAYVEGPTGAEDDCYLYMVKMLKEYESYPEKFACYMRDIPFKPHTETEANALRRLIVQRRSVRAFSDAPLPEAQLRRIVEAGSFAPTSCNAQPLAFLTLTQRDVVREVFRSATGAEDWADTVPAGIVVASDRRHYKPFDQHLIMFQDIAAAIQNCLLTCEALNLASCWVSLISDSHIKNQRAVHRMLELPDHFVVGGAIAIGQPANMVCHVPRRPIAKMWHRERFEEKPTVGGRSRNQP
jgi:nitroreductase